MELEQNSLRFFFGDVTFSKTWSSSVHPNPFEKRTGSSTAALEVQVILTDEVVDAGASRLAHILEQFEVAQ